MKFLLAIGAKLPFLRDERGAAVAAGCVAFFYAASAHAYIDPGSGGALITAILGAIGAVGYTFRKYYYKIKQLFNKRGGKNGQK
ncbi:MAG: hypothetical protein HAW59_01785 [Betaproteobacteria bacterium]|nr:hypothetical protein [Betaproteobacteria bacterium]